MGYRALLFCPEEKLARVVTQVFTELDFSVEAVQEPFAAVKKLMAQRYDAVVVDCENEQNATLLFKSARNSSSNQSSLALALVEGQAGVAKAYRIGANLVLTKPINVEQAKGTLRVARGLLRKNADPAAPSPATTTQKPTPAPVVTPAPAPTSVAHVPPRSVPEPPAFEIPAMVASTEEEILDHPVIEEFAKAAAEPVIIQPSALIAELPKEIAPASMPSPAVKPVFMSQGAAAAPAPAKEAPAPEKPRRVDPDFAAMPGSTPSFGSLEESATSQDSGGSKKLFPIAAALLVAGALGFFGWTKFGKPASTPAAPAPVVATTPTPTASVPAPSSTPPATAIPQATASQSTPASTTTQSSKPSATLSSSPTKIAIESVPVPKTPEPTPAPAPIRVKTQSSAGNGAKAGAEEVATPVPNPLAVGSATDKSISGLVTSTPTALPKQAPGTVKVSQGVSQGLLINRVQPKYPQNALAMRIQGSVQLEATINKEGKITNLKAVSGDPVLSKAASDAVRQWRYKPYYLDGAPVDIQTQITVNFKLPN